MKVDVVDPVKDRALVLQPISSRGELQRYGVTDFDAQPVSESRSRLPSPLLLLIVILPLVLTVAYNFMATDRYLSTASYVIRESQSGGSGSLALLQSGGLTRSDDNSFAVVEYIQSRDAVARLAEEGSLREVFADESIDLFSRFPTFLTGSTQEDLHNHFQKYLDVSFNTSTGISTIAVQAFSPEDANRLADMLLTSAERLVNELNQRAHRDAVQFASAMIEEARKNLQDVQSRITAFRNAESLITPDTEVTISSTLLTGMMQALVETDTQLSQMLASTPDNPRIEQLQLRRDVLMKTIEEQRASLAGGNESLALKMEGYDTLQIERQLAEQQMISAVNALHVARQESQSRRLYLERVVEPNVPDRFEYPKRFLNIFIVLIVSLSIYWLLRRTTEILLEETD